MDYGGWMVGIYTLEGGWPFLNDVNLLIVVLGRRKDQFFCVVLEDERGIFGIFVSLTPDHAVGDNAHDPNHPQKDTDPASWYKNVSGVHIMNLRIWTYQSRKQQHDLPKVREP
jgi:hypothetical protein